MEERINGGYTIIQSVPVGNTEFVLGENQKAPDPYVTWECRNGTDYNWGHYFGSYFRARTNLFLRALELAQREEEQVISRTGDTTPSWSPWGEIQTVEKLCSGVYSVSTPSHGGIMVIENQAKALFSPEALKCSFLDAGYYCFEEDCDEPVAIRELLDKKKIAVPVNNYYAPGEYVKNIDEYVQRFHPEYWNDRQHRMDAAARKHREKERER